MWKKFQYLSLLEVEENVLGILGCLERIISAFTIKVLNIGGEQPLWFAVLRWEVDGIFWFNLLEWDIQQQTGGCKKKKSR